MTVFEQKAPWIMAALMRQLNIGVLDAAAILGNIGHECAGFEHLAQLNGTAYGWPQWDGVRRRQYFEWCRANKLNKSSDEANYGFLVYELTDTWEKKVIPAIRREPTLYSKTRVFMEEFERPGVPHLSSRVEWAKMALAIYERATTIEIPNFAGGGIITKKPPVGRSSPGVVPTSWMPQCRMERVIAHWSAGRHHASNLDMRHYHIIVEGDGDLVRGDHSIKANENPKAGTYAAHTLNCNTKSIGISLACMWNAKESPFDPGPAPMTRAQWDKMILAIADLVVAYDIPVNPKSVLSHAEVQANLGIRQRGKWDFTRLAFDRSVVGAKACGDRMRREVLAALRPKPKPTEPPYGEAPGDTPDWGQGGPPQTPAERPAPETGMEGAVEPEKPSASVSDRYGWIVVVIAAGLIGAGIVARVLDLI